MGTSTATAEGAGLCTKSVVAQTDRACKSLQEVGHGQVPNMLAKGEGQARDGRVPHVKAAAAVIQHYYGLVETGNGKSTVRDMMESDQQVWLLNTNQGWARWSARSAHWRYRCEVKAGASPVFTSYLTTWLRELCEWVGFYSGERRGQWTGFKHSLEQLRDTGVQPRQGEVRVKGGLSAWWQPHTECFTQDGTPAHTVGIGKQNHAQSARGRQARECFKEYKT